MSLSKVILEDLIRFPSISPNDEGCQDYMINYLERLGFQCERYPCPPTSNFFARYGQQTPMLLFAGHTDVVPPGDLKTWHTDPFKLHEHNSILYGRGTADMKGGLACMLASVTRFIENYPAFPGSIGFLITSAEESDIAHTGTPYVIEKILARGDRPDFCIIGEPSSHEKVGDTVKNGRRGSLSAEIFLRGKQGHVAYPHLAKNPIHLLAPALTELLNTTWDNGNAFFPPSSLQVTRLEANSHAHNVIPELLTLYFNIRYSSERSSDSLREQIMACFKKYNLTPDIHWILNGDPFLTSSGKLIDSVIHVIQRVTGQQPTLSTSGGTSDGRFIAPHDIETIELGLTNNTIHQANECIASSELDTLTTLYYELCKKLFCSP